MTVTQRRGPDFVQSLERGLAVIRAFDDEAPELTLSDVARRTGITRAAARRFLLTLVELGYMRNAGGLFALRPRVLELGYAYLSTLSLPQVAMPHLEELAARIHESSSVSVLDDRDIVYVARVPTKRIMSVNISVGTRFPAVSTSMGRVLLAALAPDVLERFLTGVEPVAHTSRTATDRRELRRIVEQVREQGWAMVDQELEEGLRSVAVPLHDASGAVVAAINVSTHAARTSMSSVRDDLLPPLRATAERIEADLSGLARHR